MKKILCLVLALALTMCVTLVLAEEDAEVALMTYAEYAQAEVDDPVYVETYVQATQSWWDNKVTVYGQSEDGAIFIYNLSSSKEDAEKLVPGTKIAVKGYKAEWAGEVEVMDGTFEFVENGDTWIAEATDVTELLGTDARKLVNFVS